MDVRQLALAGVRLLVPTPHRDDRGLFTRTFDAEIAARSGIVFGPQTQDSQSRSLPRVRRGLHGRGAAGEAKLVRVSAGAVLDVVVDARPGSVTFGQHLTVELDDENFCALYVPAGFLHGFQVLRGPADVQYRIDRPHDPSQDLTVRHDDPDLAIAWPSGPAIMSERDLAAGSWAALVEQLRG